MSGGGYGVDPQILKQVAQGINDALDELKKITDATGATTGQGFSDLSVAPNEMGHSAASQRLDDFAQRWGWEVQALLNEGDDVAGTLDLNAGYYHEAEEYGMGVLKDVALSATADPTLTSQDAEKMSWSQVGGRVGDRYDPDYSMAGFENASEESRRNLSATWTDVTGTGTVGGEIGVLRAAASPVFGGDDDGQDSGVAAKGK
ncbi:hypothetical protein M2160_004415 [Streptomyces sp. SAI-117]|uniref:hypothetical protein n=1 Tax=Streptomyces sp. SAI-117 TaxID=2940546 RepID=UPI002474E229|nr:hypothetical protein [Streptomyces sp. SAI-117]MDH6569394.1 hypothetical protein [Streptomyces sp. SAI-117]